MNRDNSSRVGDSEGMAGVRFGKVPPRKDTFPMKRVLAGACALAATTVSITTFTLIPAAHASAVSPTRPAPTDTVGFHVAVTRQLPAHAVLPLIHTVTAGDTLSGLAVTFCNGKASDWTGFYARNRKVIGADPNLIYPGQKLDLTRCTDPPALLRLGEHHAAQRAVVHAVTRDGKTWGVTYGYPNKCGDGDYDGWDVNCATVRDSEEHDTAPVARHGSYRHHHHHYYASGTYHGSGGYESCVIARESGGNPSAVNPTSGAGGLYQFLPSTWHSLGYSGSPQDAPVSVQRQAFQRLYAQAGTSPWSPSDGC